jgi:hypothetical protein
MGTSEYSCQFSEVEPCFSRFIGPIVRSFFGNLSAVGFLVNEVMVALTIERKQLGGVQLRL